MESDSESSEDGMITQPFATTKIGDEWKPPGLRPEALSQFIQMYHVIVRRDGVDSPAIQQAYPYTDLFTLQCLARKFPLKQ
jgi:hypothetical protein